MAQVVVTIAGRTYRMNCDEGEEGHIESLAQIVDAKIGELRGAFGEIGDQRITVMAAITVADELSATQRRLRALEEAHEKAKAEIAAQNQRQHGWAEAAAEALEAAAAQVEAATRALNGRG